MKENIISNPFVACTARDMRNEEIIKYWCNPFETYGISEETLFTSRTPIVIEGARGTGKTMILKHMSFYVQKEISELNDTENLVKYLQKTGIGVYFRYKEDFCNLFSRLDCDVKQRERIFTHFFELFIIRQIIDILSKIYENADAEVRRGANVLCDFLQFQHMSFKDMYSAINKRIEDMDAIINFSSYDSHWVEKINKEINTTNLIVGVVQCISNNLTGWENIQFNILLDEYENTKEYQILINTMLKQVDDTANISYRVGMRPEGMENNRTYVGDECLQIDRDFILYPLKCRSFTEYKNFALKVARKRLESVDIYKNNKLTNIISILGAQEDIDAEAKEICKDNRHFKILNRKFDEEKLRDVEELLACEEKLMEMYNIIRVERGADYQKISKICNDYKKIRSEKKLKDASGEIRKYHLDYSSKYRVTLLYILLAIHKKKKMYYSVKTFLYLSSGSINDFISLCRNTFNYIDEEMLNELKKGEIISPKIQTEGALKTAINQLRKVSMSNRYGKEMNAFIDNLGRIFDYYHKDLAARYPETNQFAFENENAIYQDDKLNSYISELINVGAIIKPDLKQNISIGKPKGYVYKLNRIFAPIYQFSYRTRGGFNCVINKEELYRLLSESVDPKKFVLKEIDQHDLSDFLEEFGNE